MLSESLWIKSFAGVIWGLLISITLMLNCYHILPLPRDVSLLTGLLLAFNIWVMVMVYCYASNNALKASLGCLKVLVVSLVINIVFFLI